MSNLSTYWVCAIVYGRNTVLAYSSKVLHCLGGSIFTNATPSKSFTYTSGGDKPLSCLKQGSRSDVCPSLSFPIDAKDGGSDWFSCLKKFSRLPSLILACNVQPSKGITVTLQRRNLRFHFNSLFRTTKHWKFVSEMVSETALVLPFKRSLMYASYCF